MTASAHHLNGWWMHRAKCSCGWLSEPLPTSQARREAHTQHVKEQP